MAIIGAGPAGFYTAYRVLTKLPTAHIDMYESLPVPYGLVRFGVAPDHPEVKNCQDKFAEVASHPNFQYLGNIPIGLPEEKGVLPLASIVPHYNALVLSYGASRDKKLNIPGEDTLRGVYSARDFVGWYNGNPENRGLDPGLENAEEAVIIGQGNVALDVARMLLSRVDRLRETDVTEYALEKLARSRVRRVRVVGRRGPMQASFTIKELRELLTLPSVFFHPIPATILPPPFLTSTFPRSQKRILEILHRHNTLPSLPVPAKKSWSLNFLLAPTHFHSLPTSPTHLSSIQFQHTLLPSPPLAYSPSAPTTFAPSFTTFPAQLAFKSIGYLSLPLPGSLHLGIPFNPKLGLIPNENGRVVIPQETGPEEGFKEIGTIRVPGVYAAGWVKRGPTGVITSTMFDAFETGDAVVEDWVRGAEFMGYEDGREERDKRGWEAVEEEARGRGVRKVGWEEWRRIEEAERERGRRRGKEREKFGTVEEMLGVLE
ncbi:NADPH:adrenodoxin oxidoreductase-like protein [Tirmania nivea]|nr:NADPH:adrenodoxin oxidoreductase-like protein [Tirmania nivea]